MLGTGWSKWVVVGVIAAVVVLLIWDRLKASVVFFCGVAVLLVTQIVTPSMFLKSFGNESIAAIFLLILITAGIKNNYDLIGLFDRFYSKAKNPRLFVVQLSASVSLLSSVMNNTPIVALMIPYVYQWGKNNKISPSKLLIPLSYAAILGGMITVIGTSTNLVLNGFLRANNEVLLTLQDFVVPGLLVSVGGIVFLATWGYSMLPGKPELLEEVQDHIREYLVETEISTGSPIAGQSVTEANLRNLEGIFLVEILRNGRRISPVDPQEILEQKDRLFFAGDTDKVIDLIKDDNGLILPKTEKFNLGKDLDLIEVVVPANSNLSGKTLKETDFREKYDAAVVAIHRNGERVSGKLGEVTMAFGDLLLLTTGNRFGELSARDKNLYVVSYLQKLEETKPLRKKLFMAFFVLMVAAIVFKLVSFFVGLVLILGGMLSAKMMNAEELKKNVNLDLLIVLGSAITLGSALIETGGAGWIANGLIGVFRPYGEIGILLGLYFITLILTSFVTNVAAVSIVFPVAYTLVHEIGLSGTPFYLAIAFAASAAFLTPVSYQTNLMIYGPGNYRFNDFLKVGAPMTVLYSLICITYLIIRYNIAI
tara:strand:- start:6899 stop:8680 length:1782 start_codon:yes stop_codon:yes gene_type:complete